MATTQLHLNGVMGARYSFTAKTETVLYPAEILYGPTQVYSIVAGDQVFNINGTPQVTNVEDPGE